MVVLGLLESTVVPCGGVWLLAGETGGCDESCGGTGFVTKGFVVPELPESTAWPCCGVWLLAGETGGCDEFCGGTGLVTNGFVVPELPESTACPCGGDWLLAGMAGLFAPLPFTGMTGGWDEFCGGKASVVIGVAIPSGIGAPVNRPGSLGSGLLAGVLIASTFCSASVLASCSSLAICTGVGAGICGWTTTAVAVLAEVAVTLTGTVLMTVTGTIGALTMFTVGPWLTTVLFTTDILFWTILVWLIILVIDISGRCLLISWYAKCSLHEPTQELECISRS